MLILKYDDMRHLPHQILLRDGLTFGRSSTTDVQLSDPASPNTISRNHAVVLHKGSAWEIHDTRSLNGVFVNGKQQDTCQFEEGDTVCFGGSDSRIAYTFRTVCPDDVDRRDDGAARQGVVPHEVAAVPHRSLENIHDKYDIKEVLGRGAFGIVRLAIRREDSAPFAVKIMNPFRVSGSKLLRIRDEAAIMSQIDHPNCIKLHEVYERGNHIYLVMELALGGELLARRIDSEAEVVRVLRELSGALLYLHSRGIVHRDLKPRNIMYASKSPSSEVKIADFGLASCGELAINECCGTPQYVSPEVLEKQPVTASGDMWSLGVIAYLLLCGFLPFYSRDRHKLESNIKHCLLEFPSPYWDTISAPAKHLVAALLRLEPSSRLTASQVLEHPFITGQASPVRFQVEQRIQTHLAKAALRRTVHAIAFLLRVARTLHALTVENRDNALRKRVATESQPRRKKKIQEFC